MVTDLRMLPLGFGAWRLVWASDETVFRIYRDGLLIGTTRGRTFHVAAPAGEFPVFEVLDDAEGEPQRAYPGRLILGWYARMDESPAAESYLVQERINDEWVTRQTVRNDGRTAFHRFTTRVLEDAQEHTFRIVPIAASQNAGMPLEFVTLLVRVPDPPQATFTYDANDGTVTIAVA